MRAPRWWWPFELVTGPENTTVWCLIVHLPRNTELFVWWERRPRVLLKRWGAEGW
jgi:hypothetical protein